MLVDGDIVDDANADDAFISHCSPRVVAFAMLRLFRKKPRVPKEIQIMMFSVVLPVPAIIKVRYWW